MSVIAWSKLPREKYDNMVSVLLSHLHPTAQRIDGSGGDGGRDVQLRASDRLDIFQLKSFTGRMTKGRRRQVLRSLKRAAALEPDSWTLVVPIDFNPSEEEWFESLRKDFAFPLDWKGLTWLDAQMAARPFIARYFQEGAAEEVVNLMLQMREEEAALQGGVPQALERLTTLLARVNELDPYYEFDLATQGDMRIVTVRPRYPQAVFDRPIRFSFRLAFPETEAGQEAKRRFQRFVDFGSPVELEPPYVESVTIDAPAGLGGDFSALTHLRLGAADLQQPVELTVRFAAVSPQGETIAELPVTFNQRTRGARGAILTGTDRTGTLRITLEIDLVTGRVNIDLNFYTGESTFPEDVVRVLDLLAALRPPNRLVACDDATGIPFGDPAPAPEGGLLEENYPAVIGGLARIQRETRVRFPIPAILNKPDLEAMDRALHLLDGNSIAGTWTDLTVVSSPSQLRRYRREIENNESFSMEFLGQEEIVTIAGKRVSVGRKRVRFTSARVKNRDVVLQSMDALGDDDPLEVMFVPGGSNHAEFRVERS